VYVREVKVLFVSGVAPIVADVTASKSLFAGALGLALSDHADYPATDDLDGIQHFGVWSLHGAALACFGTDDWPDGREVPQGTVEFEVDDVDAAATELAQAGHELLVAPKTEPWGQRVARLQTSDGLLIAVTHTPWMHATKAD
jgi:catechol 2,3-dioxygenase-like lactoylglutathione lyase family enzyme